MSQATHEQQTGIRQVTEQVQKLEYLGTIDAFVGHGIYDPASPGGQYVQDRVRVLCGDEYAIPDSYLIQHEGINAAATTDTVVVHDDTLTKLTYQEEVDALIGHEIGHVVRGHSCRRAADASVAESLGNIRAGELEADIFSMMLLDKRGINPLGVISLMNALANVEKNENGNRPKYASPTHGDTLERRVTLEQALSVIDVKHLSADLTPLEIPEHGTVVGLQSEGYARLPAAAQQAMLTEAWQAREDEDRNLELQKKLVTRVDPTIDPEDLDITARAILDARTIRNSQSVMPPDMPSAEAAMYGRFMAIDSVAARQLVPKYEREQYMQARVSETVAQALVDEAVTVADVHNLMVAVDQIYEVQVDPVALFKMNGQPYTPHVFSKTVEAIATTRVPIDSLELPDSFDKESIVSVLDNADKKLANRLASLDSTVEKLQVVAGRQEIFGGEDYLQWGFNFETATFDDKPGVVTYARRIRNNEEGQSLSMVSRRLHAEILDSNPIELAKNLAAVYAVQGDSRGMHGAAQIAMRVYLDDFDRGDLAHISLDELTVLAVMTGTTDYITTYFDKGAWHDDSESQLDPAASLRANADEILSRVRNIKQASEILQDTLPGDFVPPDIQGLANESSAVQMALLFRAFQKPKSFRELLANNAVPVIAVNELLRTNKQLAKMVSLWDQTAETVLQQPDLMQDEGALLTMAALGMSSSDLELRLALPTAAFQQIARLRSFEDGLKLFDEFPANAAIHYDILNILIEEKAETAEDFERLNAVADVVYNKALANNVEAVGRASVLDAIVVPHYAMAEEGVRKVALKVDRIRGLESSKLLAGLLSSGEDDSLLKQYMAERWWLKKRTGIATEQHEDAVKKYFVPEEYIVYRAVAAKRPRLMYWLQNEYPKPGSYEPFDDDMSKIYLATAPARFLAVRKLLLAPGDGILMGDKGQPDLVDALMRSWLTIEADDERVVTRDLLLDLITKNEVTDTYQHIGPMLQDMILKVPKNPTDSKVTTKYIADGVIQGLIDQNRLRNPTEEDSKLIHYRVHKLFTGLVTGEATSASDGEDEATIKNRLLATAGVLETESSGNKLSTIGFAALAGKKSGALGVKMLQLAGQYFDLSPDDMAAFEGVYDDMVGQTRLQAYNTLKREASTDPQTAELLASIKTFGPRVGGGSLFTVYKAHMHDGSETAVGLKNPNAGYRVGKLAHFTATGLDATVQKHPGSTSLRLMNSLLEDAATWVNNELEDVDSEHKDAVFAAENDTRKSDGFSKGRSRYDLVTPNVKPNNSAWVRAEAFVDGKNLTGLQVVVDRPTSIPEGIIHSDDFKQVASLVTRNYVHQVMNGSYAHSDIHPGNFRVTADNSAVAVFDRHNLIPMKPELRKTVMAAFESIISEDLPGAMLEIASYANDGQQLSESLKSSLADIAGDGSREPSKMIADAIVTFKKAGLHVPLDLSLVLRNFMSISQLSAKAGFAGLGEAFLHTAGPDDLKQFGL